MQKTLIITACIASLAMACIQAQDSRTAISGKWIGSFDIVHADGAVEPGDAYVALVENSGTLTGSAGQSASNQTPIASGQRDGNKVAFELRTDSGRTIRFDLTIEGDTMNGAATGIPSERGSNVVVRLKRAGPAWQVASPIVHVADKLRENVAALDRRLFEAYNTCDLATLEALVSEDLEFYHDKTGLEFGRKPFIDAIRKNICGKVRRVLVPESFEVHRISQYGAMEMGKHRFHHPGQEETGVGEGKFVMLWKFNGAEWKLTRVISYDHASAKD